MPPSGRLRFGHLPDSVAVIALVEEEARLLAVDWIALILEAVFEEEDGNAAIRVAWHSVERWAAKDLAVLEIEALSRWERGHLAAHQEHEARARSQVRRLSESFDDDLAPRQPARSVALDDNGRAVTIDDQPVQPVVFAVAQPVASRDLVIVKDGCTLGDGCIERRSNPAIIDWRSTRSPHQEAHAKRAERVEETNAQNKSL